MSGDSANGVLPAKQIRSQRRQRAILDAAHRLLETRGYEHLKMEEIAAEAGSSVGAVYQRFRNKEGLLEAMLSEVLDDLQVRMSTELSLEAMEGDFRKAIRIVVELVVAFMRDNQGFVRALTSRQLVEPEGVSPLQETARDALLRGWSIVSELSPDLDDERARLRFMFAMQLVMGTCSNAVLNRPGPLQIHDDRLVDCLAGTVERLLADETLPL